MAVLTDGRIMQMVVDGYLISENFRSENVTPNGYDVTIGSVKSEDLEESPSAEVKPKSPFWVSSEEYFRMPSDIGAQIWIRSSYARKGIIGSFGFIDAGFIGTLTLSFYNGASRPVMIEKGSTIAQIIFMELENSVDAEYGQRSGHYQEKRGINL